MRRLITVMFALLLIAGSAAAQMKKVSGVVISAEDNEPIIGASVLAKGTTNGTITDFDGRFEFNVEENVKTLTVSYIGMNQLEQAVGQNLRIVMHSSSEELDEVVVVAYGTQSSKSLTSSVASVRGDALKDVPSVSFDQMLQGRASGVSITSPSGGVGQPPVVNIRGVSTVTSGSQPLYVVDGMPINSGDLGSVGNANALADINPSDILSMEVLKDASAASLYGSRAANGVILITTKRGSAGTAKVSYDMNVGFSQATKIMEVMNAQQYTDFKNMAYYNRYGTDEVNGKKVFNTMEINGRTVDTNWADQVYKNGLSQNHTISISGGSQKTNYYMSANYTETEGIVIGDNYERLSLKANVSAQTTDWLKVGVNTNYSKSKTSALDGSRSGSTFASSGLSRLSIILPSNLPVYGEDGKAYYEAGNGIGKGNNQVNTGFFNPVALYELGDGTDTYVTRMIASAFGEVTPVKNLVLRTQYGIDAAVVEDKRFWNPLHGSGFGYEGTASGYHANNNIWTWTNTANYKYDLGSHHFDLLAGMETMKDKYNWWRGTGNGIKDDAFDSYEAGYTSYTGNGRVYERTMISYFGRFNYDYDYKYMFSANARRDGYSPLGENSRWGTFGGASAAWRISGEGFMADVQQVNDLKVKASWGRVGNANIGYYASKSVYSSESYGDNPAYIMSDVKDNNLKWESTDTYDIGLSARLFNRISVDMDYYYSKSSDLILDVAQAPSTGIYDSKLRTNAGTIENKGFEFALSADVIKNKNFSWVSSLNVTFNQNKVLKLSEDLLISDDSGFEYNNISVEGKSLAQLYLYPTAGIDKETGRRIFINKDGDKVLFHKDSGNNNVFTYPDGTIYSEGLDGLEQTICGNTLPKYYGGWTNTFSYKGFDLNVFFQFSGGNYIYNGTKATSSDMRFWNNSTDVMRNAWSETNKNATYARPVYGDNVSNGSAMSISDWVEKGDYLRLKNVSLGYTFDTRKWSKKLGVSSLRVYAQAQNLFVITGYSGLDPEVISNTVEPNLAGGIDKNTLPQARTYTFGVNVSF